MELEILDEIRQTGGFRERADVYSWHMNQGGCITLIDAHTMHTLPVYCQLAAGIFRGEGESLRPPSYIVYCGKKGRKEAQKINNVPSSSPRKSHLTLHFLLRPS